MLTSYTYEELTLGRSASLVRTVTLDDIRAFAAISGDLNPTHLEPDFAAQTPFREPIAHGMFAASLISAVLGTRLPGPGTIYLNQSLSFRKPVFAGDTLEATVSVLGHNPVKRWVRLDCRVTNQKGELVLSGEAEVIPPAQHGQYPEPALPVLRVQDSGKVAGTDLRFSVRS